jgi:energy-coupling factor transport system ATP-binding protein
MSKSAIEFKDTFFRYRKDQKWVLEGLALCIPQGSVWLLVGPTGSGKSTILYLARGFHKEFGGEFKGDIQLNGRDVTNQSFYTIGDLGVGFVSQDPSLNLHQLTVRDEILSTPIYRNMSWAECNRLTDETVSFFGLTGLMSRGPTELSGGEMQKVAIASALTVTDGGRNAGGILLLDEPESFLDSNSKQDLDRVIRRLKGVCTTVITTHNPEDYIELADGVTLVAQGQAATGGQLRNFIYSDSFERNVGIPLSAQLGKRLKSLGCTTSQPVTAEELGKEVRRCAKHVHQPKLVIPEPSSESILKFEDIHFKYPDGSWVLKGVSARVPAETLTAVVGGNGSGKSTLAKLSLNLLGRYEGRISFAGTEVRKYRRAELAKLATYIPQLPKQFFLTNTVREECELTAEVHELSGRRVKIDEALAKAGLSDHEGASVDGLSGGQSRLLTLAASSFMVSYRLLFVDEPEFGVDKRNLSVLLRHFMRLRDLGSTVVIITHDPETILYSDWVIVMEHGKVVKSGHPYDVYGDKKELDALGLVQPAIFPAFELAWRKSPRISDPQDLLDAIDSEAFG